MDLAALAGPTLAAFAGGGAVTALINGFFRRKPDAVQAATAFQAALNTQAEAFVKQLQELIQVQEGKIARLDSRVDELEGENERCRRENARLMARIAVIERGGRDPVRTMQARIGETVTPRKSVAKPS